MATTAAPTTGLITAVVATVGVDTAAAMVTAGMDAVMNMAEAVLAADTAEAGAVAEGADMGAAVDMVGTGSEPRPLIPRLPDHCVKDNFGAVIC